MKILIANPGSTSYKCKLFEMKEERVLFQAAVERIGEEGLFSWSQTGKPDGREKRPVPDYTAAVRLTLEKMEEVVSLGEVQAVGFKTVLAKGVTGCVALSDGVMAAMESYLPLAPVHTQVYLTAISVFKTLAPSTPLYGLFETSFHRKIPPEAFLYGIPFEFYEKYGIRKYGFHGASHTFVASRIAEKYRRKSGERIISCHLGGSSSVCAIRGGVSVDTSMGMSPQCGLLNAKRVGDLDSFALLYLMEKEKLSIAETRQLLASRGGVYGISGVSGDFRDIIRSMEAGNERARFAFEAFAYGVKRYIGEYLAVLNGADFIACTGGLGQNSPLMRKRILENMENLGIVLDDGLNNSNPKEGLISAQDSAVALLVIPTDEEWIVAREVAKKAAEK